MDFLKQKSMSTDRAVAGFFGIYGLYGLFFAKTFSKKILMLEKIKNNGFTIELDDDGFTVSPAEKLTDKQREFLKVNKSQIMRELLLTTIYTPAGGKVEIEAKDATHKAWLIEHNHKSATPVVLMEG